ncbi:hypothetical protein DFS34DRAFT_682702 [Phlyctochytrium arcticum]|nr:hypothetical protein DFS34DRAFT_682702 [Phlyctochytrium arcticum]
MSSNGNPASSRATSSRNRNPSARSQEAAASTLYFKWTIVPQQYLLNWLGEDDNYNRFCNAGKVDASGRSRSSGKTKIAVAGEAAGFLGTKGFQADAKQVQSKVTQFEDKYRAATKELAQTGNGLLTTEAKMGVKSIRDKVLKICPCFKDLNPIFMDRAVHKPLLTTDSSQGFHGLISTLGRRPSPRTDDANDPESRDAEGPSTGAAMPAPRRRTGMAIQSIMNDDEGTRSPSTRRDSASLSPQRATSKQPKRVPIHAHAHQKVVPTSRQERGGGSNCGNGGHRWVATQPKKPTPGIPSNSTGHCRLGQPRL